MLKHSEEINEIATALAAAGPDLKNPKKDKEVSTGTYTYKYAQLDTILESVKPILSKNGIAIIQDAANIPGAIVITTMLLHKSGQWFSSELEMPTGANNSRMNGAQAVGSAITYGRRYSITALLGIAAEEDDDGAGAGAGAAPVGGSKTAPRAPAAKPPSTAPVAPKFVRVTKEQGEKLTTAATAIGYDKKKLGDFIKAQFKIAGPEEFSSAMCDKIIVAFENKAKDIADQKAAEKSAAEDVKVEEEPKEQGPFPWDEPGPEIDPAAVDSANEPVETPNEKQQRIDENIKKAGAK